MRFTEEEREETECKKTEVTSKYKLHVQYRGKKIKIKNDPAATKKGKATNCTRESRQVTTYSNGGKLTLPL